MYDLGLLIKELRKKANLTQKQLGDKLGITEPMISKYESNTSIPPFETMRSLAVIFNVSMDFLSGMEKKTIVSVYGLTNNQIEIINNLVEIFKAENLTRKNNINSKQYEILGRILADFLSKN